MDSFIVGCCFWSYISGAVAAIGKRRYQSGWQCEWIKIYKILLFFSRSSAHMMMVMIVNLFVKFLILNWWCSYWFSSWLYFLIYLNEYVCMCVHMFVIILKFFLLFKRVDTLLYRGLLIEVIYRWCSGCYQHTEMWIRHLMWVNQNYYFLLFFSRSTIHTVVLFILLSNHGDWNNDNDL